MVLRRGPVPTLTYRPKTVNSFSRAASSCCPAWPNGLTRTDGQRLVVYMAAPGTADYDATVLLSHPSHKSLTAQIWPLRAATILGVSFPGNVTTER
jgi:hypothetical protein